ncbi:hypothetical protein [Okeania sp. KiyG1]|uniref:hypothetical protein n=1 Tax=Okeania sp. KiyG1 TaxID=2720165 RepID=UPI00192152C5|nr:hypothetical protein [Okeania sp. KiyG1]
MAYIKKQSDEDATSAFLKLAISRHQQYSQEFKNNLANSIMEMVEKYAHEQLSKGGDIPGGSTSDDNNVDTP